MGIFSRKKQKSGQTSGSSTPIREFWDWWQASGRLIDPTAGPTDEMEALNERVQAIHPDLTWHFGPGTDAAHRLTVSAAGIAEVRPFAARWHRSAPAADETWEFAAAVEADPNALSNTLQLGGCRA